MNIQQPPEGILDPQQPYWPTDRVGEVTWLRLKGKLTGRSVPGLSENFTSYVKLGDADADRLIENIKKYGQYPQVNQNDQYGGAYNNEAYQKWLVEEFLEKPFREQVDQKIIDRQAARAFADVLNRRAAKKAVQLTTDVIEDPWGEGTVPAKQYAVVPTTKLLPPAKEVAEEQKPEAKKRGSSLVKSMTKTFARMETHFQKLTELSATSEGNVSGITDAFRIQSDALVKGFQDTTALVNKVAAAVDLQATTMVRIAKGKKDLDQKALDAQQSLNEEMQIEQQSASSGNAQVKGGDGPGSAPGGGGIGGAIGKVLGGSALANFVAGKGLKKIAGKVSSKAGKKVTEVALRRALGKDAAEGIAKTIGREAAEAGVEKGIGKAIGKKVPLIGLGLGAFFAAERAAKGDMLGAALELASGAASTFPGIGTGASIAIDATLVGRDTGVVPFAKGGLTQKSTFSGNRPGVTDLSPDLFKKMYQYELDYEQKNKNKFGKIYADGYEKYFAKPSLPNILGSLLSNFVSFFKNIVDSLGNGLRNGLRGLNDLLNPRTGTTTNQFKDVLPEGNPQLTSRFGPRTVSWGSKNHPGIDIGVDRGSRVLSLEDGVVSNIMRSFGGHGDAVVVDHGDGTKNVYGHVDASVKEGDKIKKGQQIATVKYWPGSGAQPSDNTHLHLERRVGGGSYKAIDPARYLNERAGVPDPQVPVPRSTGQYDIIIPLDHVPPNLSGKFPDDNAKTSFRQSEATGADGREREQQDKAAAKLKAKLEASGLRVLIMKPESFKSYQDYDANIKAHAAKGTRILPLHFDASRSGGGTGFLTRTRRGDSADAAFAAPIQQALANFQSKNKDLGNLSKDTASNATVNAGAASPTALVELGVMVDWENKYGKNFTGSTKFNELIEALSNAVLKTTKPRVRPRNVRGGGTVYEPVSSRQTDQLVAMAPIEDTAQQRVFVSVNNNTPVVVSSDNNNEEPKQQDSLKQLHLAAIG